MSYNRKNNKLSRRRILKSGLYGSLTVYLSPVLWFTGCSKNKKNKRPNVILIVIDTLRADHVGCYGYHRNITPNIDKLADESLRFKNAISSAPWTTPSVAALLTSQYPSVMGFFGRVIPVNKRFQLLSEILKQHNYSTFGVISHALLSGRLGFARGFDSFEEVSSSGHKGISSPQVTEKALGFLRTKKQQPFFLFLHYFDPHYNYQMHSKYNFYKSYRGKLKSNQSILDLWKIRDRFSGDDIKYLLSLFDSEIAFTDEYIGVLFSELKKLNLYEDSIIIVTADHGEEFMERGWLGHTTKLYQEMLKVPLIIKFPGLKKQVIDFPVGLINIVPTIYKYMELEIPDYIEGKPLNFESAASAATGPVFSETFNPQVHQPRPIEPLALRSIVLGNRKLIFNQRKNTMEIYDLSKDPYEKNNLAANQSEQNQRLKVLLSQWISYVENKQKPTATPDETELFTPEQIKQLKSLGYLE